MNRRKPREVARLSARRGTMGPVDESVTRTPGQPPAAPPRLIDRLPTGPDARDPDALYAAFTGWAAEQGFDLYPHQAEAMIDILAGAHVIVTTPTGSGKSLIATAAHFATLAARGRTYYTAPIKALVSEKFFALCDLFGADLVGMVTGDAAVNPDAPIVCCTAEILANLALGSGAATDIDSVVMDEFHYIADPDRGWAWQVGLAELPRAQFVLMSATLGDVSAWSRRLTAWTGRDVSVIDDAPRPVPLDFAWSLEPLHDTISRLVEDGQAPLYIVHPSQQAAAERAQALLSLPLVDADKRRAIAAALGDFRFAPGFGPVLRKLLLAGIAVHHAGLLPKYRRLIETLAQQGLLVAICGTDTLGVGINLPIRTVVFTTLVKFDGRRERLLRAREFHQIAGRAGRPGFDRIGHVVVQAPDHEVENARLAAKFAGDEKKLRSVRKKKPEPGAIGYTEASFAKLVDSVPEALAPRLTISHALLLNLLRRDEDTAVAVRRLVDRATDWAGGSPSTDTPPSVAGPSTPAPSAADSTGPEPSTPSPAPAGALSTVGPSAADSTNPAPSGSAPATPSLSSPAARRRRTLLRRAVALGRSLLRAGVVVRRETPTPGGRVYDLAPGLQEDFALNQALSAFALEALDRLDPTTADDYALDVVSVIESTLEDPLPILLAQQNKARGEAVAEMKADGLSYEERQEQVAEITWPRPLAEFLDAVYQRFALVHPWLLDHPVSPKAVVREMAERAMTFAEFVAFHKATRSEGLVLRYLSDAFKALRQTVPEPLRTGELEDLIAWLGMVVRMTDSSLIDEWEALAAGAGRADRAAETGPSRGAPPERPLTGDERAFTVLIRNALFRRVQLAAADDVDGLAELDAAAAGAERRAGRSAAPSGDVSSGERRAGSLAAPDAAVSASAERRAAGQPASGEERAAERAAGQTARPSWTADDWDDALGRYWEEHDTIGTGADARSPALLVIDKTEPVWQVRQTLDDPAGHHDWSITAEVDPAASDRDQRLVLVITGFDRQDGVA